MVRVRHRANRWFVGEAMLDGAGSESRPDSQAGSAGLFPPRTGICSDTLDDLGELEVRGSAAHASLGPDSRSGNDRAGSRRGAHARAQDAR